MRTSPILAVLALSMAAQSASAQSFSSQDADHPYYVQFALGPSFLESIDVLGTDDVEFDTGLAVSGAIGRNFATTGDLSWSIEAELYYTFMKVDSNDRDRFPTTKEDTFTAFALMANLMGDYPLSSEVSLYFGGGAGYATNIKMDTFDDGNLEQNDNDKFAGQGKVGFRWNLGDRYDVSIGYRYFRTEDVEIEDVVTGDTDDVEFSNHVAEIGFRWGFL